MEHVKPLTLVDTSHKEIKYTSGLNIFIVAVFLAEALFCFPQQNVDVFIVRAQKAKKKKDFSVKKRFSKLYFLEEFFKFLSF